MAYYFLLFLASAFITSFIGYWAHRFFHSEYSGPFYKVHMNHHLIQYPPGGGVDGFISDEYKSAGTSNSLYYFVAIFCPIIGGVIGATILLHISIWTCLSVLIGMVGAGLLHDRLHDSFHLKNTIWSNLPWFKEWQRYHYIHHQDMAKNYGIFLFIFDKLFKTFLN